VKYKRVIFVILANGFSHPVILHPNEHDGKFKFVSVLPEKFAAGAQYALQFHFGAGAFEVV
jgi:hypothetical protein